MEIGLQRSLHWLLAPLVRYSEKTWFSIVTVVGTRSWGRSYGFQGCHPEFEHHVASWCEEMKKVLDGQ